MALKIITDYDNTAEHLIDREEDIKANIIGRQIGSENPNASPEEIDSKIRKHFGSPEDLIKKYEKRQKLKMK